MRNKKYFKAALVIQTLRSCNIEERAIKIAAIAFASFFEHDDPKDPTFNRELFYKLCEVSVP